MSTSLQIKICSYFNENIIELTVTRNVLFTRPKAIENGTEQHL